MAGGLEGTPPALPTAFDLSKGNFKVIGHAIWDGSWVGVSIFTANDVHMDYATGDYSFHAVDVFRGVWLGDHSRGTLTWDEDAHGNFITGATYANVDIVSGDGDPSFQCSSGHFVWDGFAPVPASYGGYSGTWIHGCRGARR